MNTEVLNDAIIQFVRDHPGIYIKSHSDYKKRSVLFNDLAQDINKKYNQSYKGKLLFSKYIHILSIKHYIDL